MVLTAQDFEAIAGDNANLEIHVQEYDTNGVLQDVTLTGSTITWVLKTAIDSTTALVTKTSAVITEIEILNQVSNKGKFVVYLLPADTVNLSASKYYHGALVYDVALDRHTVTTGYVTLYPKVV